MLLWKKGGDKDFEIIKKILANYSLHAKIEDTSIIHFGISMKMKFNK